MLSSRAQRQARTIYLAGLPNDCTEEEVRQLCKVAGKVDDVRLLAPKNKRGPRCAFCQFRLPGSVEVAAEVLLDVI